MQILNAKKSTLLFKMDNGQILQIAPGKISSPFIGTKTVLMAVVNSGSPKEIGIIVSSTYELDMMRQVNASMAYLHESEANAREVLLGGATEASSPAPVVNVEAAKNAELVESLQNKIRDLESQLEDARSNDEVISLKKANDAATEEIAKLRSDLLEATAKHDELTSIINDKSSEIKELNDKCAVLQKEAEAELPVVNVDMLPEVIALKADLKSAQEQAEIIRTNAENDTSALAAQVEQLTNELEAAKGASAPELTENEKEAISKYPIALQENQKLGEENVQLNLKVGRLEADLESVKTSHQQVVAENESLKADGKQLFDQFTALKTEHEEVTKKYEAARSATLEIMNKFNIEFVDGEWMQKMN